MRRVLSNQKISPDKLFTTFISLLILSVKANEFKFPSALISESTNKPNNDFCTEQLITYLLLLSLYCKFTLLNISDHSQRFCGWWLKFWLHPEYSQWQHDSPEGLAWLWQSQQVQRLVLDPTLFLGKIKNVNQTGDFSVQILVHPPILLIIASRQSVSQRWHFWVIHFVFWNNHVSIFQWYREGSDPQGLLSLRLPLRAGRRHLLRSQAGGWQGHLHQQR